MNRCMIIFIHEGVVDVNNFFGDLFKEAIIVLVVGFIGYILKSVYKRSEAKWVLKIRNSKRNIAKRIIKRYRKSNEINYNGYLKLKEYEIYINSKKVACTNRNKVSDVIRDIESKFDMKKEYNKYCYQLMYIDNRNPKEIKRAGERNFNSLN